MDSSHLWAGFLPALAPARRAPPPSRVLPLDDHLAFVSDKGKGKGMGMGKGSGLRGVNGSLTADDLVMNAQP